MVYVVIALAALFCVGTSWRHFLGLFALGAAAIAIARHRLYEIDLIINRTLVYVPLTGILGGLYSASVVLFQRIFVAFTGIPQMPRSS